MQRFLVALTVVWPLLLASGWWMRSTEASHPWSEIVYGAAGHICHQRPERSFHTDGVTWPVCGRCSGLYLAAPIGGLLALVTSRRYYRRDAAVLFGAAALPSALTFILEWSGATPMPSLVRALAALPLGAAIAFLIVSATDRARS